MKGKKPIQIRICKQQIFVNPNHVPILKKEEGRGERDRLLTLAGEDEEEEELLIIMILFLLPAVQIFLLLRGGGVVSVYLLFFLFKNNSHSL